MSLRDAAKPACICTPARARKQRILHCHIQNLLPGTTNTGACKRKRIPVRISRHLTARRPAVPPQAWARRRCGCRRCSCASPPPRCWTARPRGRRSPPPSPAAPRRSCCRRMAPAAARSMMRPAASRSVIKYTHCALDGLDVPGHAAFQNQSLYESDTSNQSRPFVWIL